jgi:tRNA1Val (adenine37-N6)-methyltransferase
MKVTTDACLFGAWVSEELKGKLGANNRILDIGAGTGLLSLMLAQKYSDCTINAVEIDPEAASQATKNFHDSPWAKRLTLIHADAKEYDSGEKADLLISNPPFYEEELRSPDPSKNRAHHDEGLVMRELVAIIKKHLHPYGSFFLLLPYKRKSAIDSLLLKEQLCIQKEVLVKPSPTKDYFRILVKGGHDSERSHSKETQEMEVTDEKGNYTPAFITLLKDYYLNL